MIKDGHRLITREALSGQFSERALTAIISTNVDQDRLAGQVGHDEFHFDNNAFERGKAYIAENRLQVTGALKAGDPLSAWHAFGRLTHAVQDFYAHSNYVILWLERFPAHALPPAEGIDPLDRSLLAGPLRSGRIYFPLEPVSWIPALRRFVLPLLPRDSHAWMNLDSEERGPKYRYAYAAAVKRTVLEYEMIKSSLSPEHLALFRDLPRDG